jgi:hypothetical protein
MFEKQIKKMKMLPAARNWVLSVTPLYFLAVSLIAVVIVQVRVWKK